ncbi:MAG: alpha/beta hydrolase-fold protein [Flavitalea sp.]
MEKQLMEHSESEQLRIASIELPSVYLDRIVRIDFYHTEASNSSNTWNLLLVNDGQDLVKMDFAAILSGLDNKDALEPALVVGIHCGEDRRNEYGMSSSTDYLGRGARAPLYEQFIISELLPLIESRFEPVHWKEKMFAGFSLGGLTALDIAWNHPEIFSRVGVFSGSFWWRSLDMKDKNYSDAKHRLMHKQIRNGVYHEGMKFFFECGELDESEDRNKNGVIDAIDDTIDVMRELTRKGYREGREIFYMQMADGKHDILSWAKALPVFLRWALH